jgi:hypothetical protein
MPMRKAHSARPGSAASVGSTGSGRSARHGKFRDIVRVTVMTRATGVAMCEHVWSREAVLGSQSYCSLILSFFMLGKSLGESTVDSSSSESDESSDVMLSPRTKRLYTRKSEVSPRTVRPKSLVMQQTPKKVPKVPKHTCVRRVKFEPYDKGATHVQTVDRSRKTGAQKHLRIGLGVQSPAVRKLHQMHVVKTQSTQEAERRTPYWLTIRSTQDMICAVLHVEKESDKVASKLADAVLDRFHFEYSESLSETLGDLDALQQTDSLYPEHTGPILAPYAEFAGMLAEISEHHGIRPARGGEGASESSSSSGSSSSGSYSSTSSDDSSSDSSGSDDGSSSLHLDTSSELSESSGVVDSALTDSINLTPARSKKNQKGKKKQSTSSTEDWDAELGIESPRQVTFSLKEG